ncbi:SigE family RNA polymerase sigma factor [Herbidospora yilanensis]|uniref:SigE family RNA polymerase sigma factor n=1 Tax=Herbidospora yilanensis TaxID=354426 RepID=UPI0007820021|nr:SigE family RNA polymerase sigma factor [Herbidospora yilanensis]
MDADFADFVRRRGDHHLRTAVLLTGDWHAAEDLVQTSLGKLLAVWDRLDTTAGPDAYLRKIMVNTHRSWWRARWRREIPRAELPDTAGPGDLSEGRVVAEEVRAALRRLPARQRTALVLRFFADLPEAEVAGLMGCSAGSVKAHVHRGLKAMRKLVNRTEDEGSVLR